MTAAALVRERSRVQSSLAAPLFPFRSSDLASDRSRAFGSSERNTSGTVLPDTGEIREAGSVDVHGAESPRAIHYVGFRDDRYWNAFRVFGGPRFIHRTWDQRARREIGADDVVVFANGDEFQPVARFNSVDLNEDASVPALAGGGR